MFAHPTPTTSSNRSPTEIEPPMPIRGWDNLLSVEEATRSEAHFNADATKTGVWVQRLLGC